LTTRDLVAGGKGQVQYLFSDKATGGAGAPVQEKILLLKKGGHRQG